MASKELNHDSDRLLFQALLLEEHSRTRTEEVADLIGGNIDRFAAAWDIFCNGEPPLPQRMAWVMDLVTEKHPSLAARYATSFAARLPFLKHPAEQRAVTKILARTTLPPEAIADVLVTLFDWLENPAVPVAVRANAMALLYVISQIEPDLKPELRTVIEVQMLEGSPAITSRGRTLLRRLAADIRRIEARAASDSKDL